AADGRARAAAAGLDRGVRRAARRRLPGAVRALPLARADARRRRVARPGPGRRARRVAARRGLPRDDVLPAGTRAGRAGGGAVMRMQRPSAGARAGQAAGGATMRMWRSPGGADAGRRDRGRERWRHAREPSRRSRARGRRGFTLIELLVALAVAGVVALAAQHVLAAALDARARSRTQRELALSGAARRAALESWLRAATLSVPDARFIGRPGGDAAWPADELVLAVADAGALHPGPHRIRVWVDRNPAAAPENGLIAELLPLPAGVAPPDTLVLAPAA